MAYWAIGIFSSIVFIAVVALGKFKLELNTGFDIHIFAQINAVLNSSVAILLVAALLAVKKGRFEMHRNLMYAAIFLSVLFLVSYIAHHLLAGEAKFGDINHNNMVSDTEKLQAGSLRVFYLVLLTTHIVLAAIILPFILFTSYRALTGQWQVHRKLAKYTWPLWLYVSITGPLVYYMIKPYYS